MAATLRLVPSPADAALPTARQFIREVRRRGGKVYRMREFFVFVITDNEELAQWLLKLGGFPYLPQNAYRDDMHDGAYVDAPGGSPKWDIYVHHIKVKGDETIWDAAINDPKVPVEKPVRVEKPE